MKFLFLLLTISLPVFAQSHMILANGIVLTLDRAGFIYDLGNFMIPYKVSATGGQFIIEDDRLATVDENAYLFRKDFKVGQLFGKGINYFITKDYDLVTIDHKGFHYEWKERGLKKLTYTGGNFFVVEDTLYTVNEKGNYFKMQVDGLVPKDIAHAGGNYFVSKKNVIYTVSREGFVFKKDNRVSGLKKKGGNFFVDEKNVFYTIAESGFLLSQEFKGSIKQVGANYFLTNEGQIFTIDQTGTIFARTVSGHDVRTLKFSSF
jgi:hypothetical protein